VVLALALVGAGQNAVRASAPSHDEVAVLWRDPGEVESRDLSGGPGGAQGEPQPPFQFLDEPMTGTTAKIRIVDAKGVRWMVKFGEEVRPQTFAARLVWAMGYFALPIYFVPEGTILGAAGLTRAAKYVAPNGRFRDASFEIYVDSPVRWLGDRQSWSWNANPFVGTHQLNGLKVLLMLLSDWDNKDARNVTRGSNTAILVYPGDEARYLVTDWGASMGTWGSYENRSKWNCFGFELQTRDFVRLGPRRTLEWGYVGQDTENFINGISVEDVRWLLTYLGRVSDTQLRDGLRASGATPAETSCFSRALRKRVAALQALRGVRSEAPGRPAHERAVGTSTTCSAMNQTWSSLRRMTPLTSRSFVPSSPLPAASRAIARASSSTTSCAWSSREIWTGAASRPRGARGMMVVSATSGAMAMPTPPSSWIRSPMRSTSAFCSS